MNMESDVLQWSEGDVGIWLKKLGLVECVGLFQEHDVDGEVLPYLTKDLLIEMGIEQESVRNKLLEEIAVFSVKMRKPQPNQGKAKERQVSLQRNLVDIYDEGATLDENDSIYAHADRHGFIDETGEADPEDSETDMKKKIIEREKKWQKMFHKRKNSTLAEIEQQPEFRKRIFKGIPYSWRIQVWKLMTVGDLDEKKYETYQLMLQKPTSEADENQIDLDINRTLRNHVNYKQRYGKGQKRLFNVLRAYANYNPEIGFCQGMASVAAFLLIHCDEETTFWMMDTFVSNPRFQLQGLWISGFPTLMESFYVHEKMFKYHLPKLWKHFKNQKIHPSSYATRWYMTVFLSFPFHTCLRYWDIFLFEGFDSMFFFAIASLELFQAELLSKDFEGIMEFLGQMNKHEIDDDKLISLLVRVMRRTHSSMKGKSKALEYIRNEYKKVLADGGSPFGDY